MIEGSILPKLILIGDRFTDPPVQERIVEAAKAGVRWVHLRDHEAADPDFEREATRLSARLRKISPEMIVAINARLDVARRLGLHFHTGARGPLVDAARAALGPRALIGFSAHDHDEGEAAVRLGADYLLFSPVYDTSKSSGAGIDALRNFCTSFGHDVPIYALGGITPESTGECLGAGADGIAILSGILGAAETGAAAGAYLAASQRVRSEHKSTNT